MTISIDPSVATKGESDLFLIYPGQNRPQPTFIALDIRSGRVWLDYDGEIGGAVPADVWHGLVRRYLFSHPPLMSVARAVLQEIFTLLDRVATGATVEWDGNNHVARLSPDAAEAESEIEAGGDGRLEISEDEAVAWAEAGDWLDPRDVLAEMDQGTSIEALEDQLQGDGVTMEHPILVGLERWLHGVERAKADG